MAARKKANRPPVGFVELGRQKRARTKHNKWVNWPKPLDPDASIKEHNKEVRRQLAQKVVRDVQRRRDHRGRFI